MLRVKLNDQQPYKQFKLHKNLNAYQPIYHVSM